MSRQLSFSKYENELLPSFRNRINNAESAEDVRKFFAYTTIELLKQALAGQVDVAYEDVVLTPEADHPFALSERLLATPPVTEIWGHSDLPHVLGRLAQTAVNRYRHLEKHPEKTNAKIRM